MVKNTILSQKRRLKQKQKSTTEQEKGVGASGSLCKLLFIDVHHSSPQVLVQSRPTGATTWVRPAPRATATAEERSASGVLAGGGGGADEVEGAVVVEASNLITGEAII